ncbi:MAG: efflux RND transporter periplasmic adaptor subunit [Rhodospirillales bacterium]
MRGVTISSLLVTMLAAGAAGWALERFLLQGGGPMDHGRPPAAADQDRRILYWVAPMDPNYRRDGPGKSPMGMDLIPVYEGEDTEEPGVVAVSAATAATIGVRQATVERRTLTPEVRTFGRVAYDERLTRHIHVRANGWVERLNVRREGERVRRGELLFEFFAPDLSIAAMEHQRELQRGDARGIAITRLKLQSLGVSDRQIAALGSDGGGVRNIQVYAPQDGTVAAIGIAEGMFITPETTTLSLVDLSRVWVLADVFQRDLPRVRTGLPATIEAIDGARPARTGTVETVFPTVREDTRTVELRLVFDNPDGSLFPNALTRVALTGDPIEDTLNVPADAVIRLGDGARVVRIVDEGRFEPVAVTLGPRIGDRMVIENGVAEGDRIVAAAHFLIDSASSLQRGLDQMAQADGGHGGHGGHGSHGAQGGTGHGDHRPAADPQPVWADGEVVAIDPARRAVTLDHAPVPELGWPTMVMDFQVGAAVAIEELRVGDRIDFGFVRTPDRRYEIREIRPAGPPR